VKVARPKGFEPLTSAFGVLRASCLISFSGVFSLVSHEWGSPQCLSAFIGVHRRPKNFLRGLDWQDTKSIGPQMNADERR